MKFDEPFPHTIIDDFISPETVKQINAEWPQDDWTGERAKYAYKRNHSGLPKTAAQVAQSIKSSWLHGLTGIKGLFGDPSRYGGGLHSIPRGGYLKMHVDFNVHPRGWHRRVNVLIYLNQVWQDKWGGHLQLGTGPYAKLVAPIGGRCVVFETNDQSWHGHPDPLLCPKGIQRRSMALYYYTKRTPNEEPHTTIYDLRQG